MAVGLVSLVDHRFRYSFAIHSPPLCVRLLGLHFGCSVVFVLFDSPFPSAECGLLTPQIHRSFLLPIFFCLSMVRIKAWSKLVPPRPIRKGFEFVQRR